MLLILGYISGFLGLFANLPYIIDTIKGKTHPHRISWAIFLLINIVNFANQAASGASNSLWVIAGFCLSQAVIVLLSIKKGVGGLAKLDILCLAGAVIGIALWMYFKSPMVSIISNMIASTIALIPTLIKAYKRPKTETKVSWLLGAIGAFLSAISVGSLNINLLLFPIYSGFVQLTVYLLIEYRLTTRYHEKLTKVLHQLS